MNTIYKLMVLTLVISSCSSSELVENWKNPDIDTFEANKVLVIGITPQEDARKSFEKKLVSALQRNDVNAVESLDYFNNNFTSQPRTEEEIYSLERELLANGFDAILISKVIGTEEKVSLVQAYRNLDRTFNSFRDDYYENQSIYQNDKDNYEEYKIHHAQSSLYCICPDKEREILWKGAIDVTEPDNVRSAINDYVKLLIWALSEQQLLIINKQSNESFDL
ncbi:hypothetical protein [Aquimarina brevivitae]|uniref:Cardiolipin synthetase n=1 Tax=Aquimarina brevivitae TaxID=323412 RepID=A0A4Q7PGR4_9FLAO|nr:hypothetical protein [Aquimarina brevivitae]RZS99706.1 hypothetical protein EV197_0929 [Aquimarina brevivitae]